MSVKPTFLKHVNVRKCKISWALKILHPHSPRIHEWFNQHRQSIIWRKSCKLNENLQKSSTPRSCPPHWKSGNAPYTVGHSIYDSPQQLLTIRSYCDEIHSKLMKICSNGCEMDEFTIHCIHSVVRKLFTWDKIATRTLSFPERGEKKLVSFSFRISYLFLHTFLNFSVGKELRVLHEVASCEKAIYVSDVQILIWGLS